MKQVICLGVALVLAAAASSAAQTEAASQNVTLSLSLRDAYTTLKGNLTQAAQDMTEVNYAFNPVPQSDVHRGDAKKSAGDSGRVAESKPSRTYGQVIAHQVDNQFSACATIKGVPNPSASYEAKAMKATKSELVQALADAFTFCDGAIATLTDQRALEMVKRGDGETARGALVAALIAHGHGSASTAAVYLRLKGIARPW